MSKPSTLPQWDTNLTNVNTPTSGLKSDGWAVNDVPTSSNMNWLFAWIYLWLKWIDDGIWTAVSLALSGDFTVLGTFTIGGSAVTTSLGTFDINMVSRLQSECRSTVDFASATGKSEITARAIHKAHASIVCNNSGSPTLDANDSYNISGLVANNTGGGILQVQFGTNFFAASSLPNVVVTCGDEKGTTVYVPSIIARGRDHVDIRLRDSTNGAVGDPSGAGLNGLRVYVHVEGRQ